VSASDTEDVDLLHVLVIDDDEAMRNLITQILLPTGHQVVSAESAEAGLELLPYYTFQVALLDQRLPGMEGLVLGEFLRRNNPNMKIALVTGEDDEKLVRFGEEHAITVIPKPFEVKQILDLITSYQQEARHRLEAEHTKDEVPDYDPPIGRHLGVLAEAFELPSVPKRIEERLIHAVKTSLNELRSASRYSERDRVIALSGLITLSVLGIKPPKTGAGRTLFEEYDALMKEHRRRTEFDEL
jgi:DNA-binding response OmpR family regulator